MLWQDRKIFKFDFYKYKGNNMLKLFKKIIQSLIKEDTPSEDFKRNYCKYSKGYKSYKRY